jgi:hypothetical protein
MGTAAADGAGGGVDHIVEVGGKNTYTLQQSIEAARIGGDLDDWASRSRSRSRACSGRIYTYPSVGRDDSN